MNPEGWHRLKDVFNAALERKPDERDAFLAQTCGEDATLRAEVESLLKSHARAGSFSEAVSRECAIESLEGGDADLGERIGSYKLVREIGRGGMGTVYLATRADEEFSKQVAIKIVSRGMDTDRILRRFRVERQILASLDHTNIARLFDGGTTADGRPYFVMEYIEGRPVDQYCDNHRLSIGARLKLFCTICSAVQYAHEKLVIHRDIKPENILVTTQEVSKLLDFGIAKILKPELFDQAICATVTAQRAMTPEYASPEQIRGEAITPASDVYQLGLLLYELLTGRRPYRFKSRVPEEMARVICEEETEKPSTAVSLVEEELGEGVERRSKLTPEVVGERRRTEPEKLRRQLAGDLDNVVLKAMQKDPQRRYASVQELSEDIGRHLEGLPVIARKDTLAYRSAKFIKRNKLSVIAAALFAVVIAIFVAAGFYLLHRPDQASVGAIDSLVVLPLENLSKDPAQEYFVDGMTEALITDLARIGALRVISRSSAMRYKGVRKPLSQIARELRVGAVVEGSVLRSGDRVRITAQLYHPATDRHISANSYESSVREILALQGDLARAIATEIRVRLTAPERARLAKARTVNPEAYDFYLRGKFLHSRRNKADNLAAIEMLERAVARDPTFATGYAAFADACRERFFTFTPWEQKQWEEKAYVALEKALSLDPDLAEAYFIRGRLLWTPSHHFAHERAIQEYRRALALNPNLDGAHEGLANIYNHVGLLDEGLKQAQKAAGINPNNAQTMLTIGEGLSWQGKYEEALSVWRSIPREFYASNVKAYTAWALFQLGRKDEAWTKIETFVKEDPEDTRGVLASIQALLWAASGQYRKAEDKIKSAAEKKAFGPFHHTAYFIASAYARINKPEPAIQWLQNAADNGFPCYPLIERDPNFDSLRKHPRFVAFMETLKKQWEDYRKIL